jgi:cytochrome P450
MHKILYKAFIPANLHTFIPVFVRQTRLIADLLDSAAATGSTHEMVLAFNDLTLRVMVDAGFGNMIGPDDHKKVLTAIRHTLSATQNPLHDIPILCKLPFPANLELERQFRNLHEAADRVIAARSAAHSDGTYEASHDGKYMVDLLLEARETEGQLSDVELRDNIIMLLVAGSETTGTTLSWVIWHMCLYPDVYKKALQEVDSLDISWDHFNVSNFDDEMPYMTKVINETMRVKPAVSGIPERIYTEDSTLGDLYLPKGSRVGVSTIVMHHNPDYWPDAETFDPERFSEENTKARHRFSYLPFGLGRRMCMGKQFALNEMRVVLGLLLK